MSTTSKAVVTPPDEAGMRDLILTVIANGGKLDNTAHQAVVSALARAADPVNELDSLTRILGAMPKSANRTALLIYIKAHAPVKWKKKSSEFRLKRSAKPEDFKVKDAAKMPFWDYVMPDQPRKPFNAEQFCVTMRKKLDRAIEEGEFNAHQEAQLRRGLASIIVDYTTERKQAIS